MKCSDQVGLLTSLSCVCFSTEDNLLAVGYFVMMYNFSVYYFIIYNYKVLRPVFMNHLKLVDQKMIIIVLVLPYLLNLKKVELIPLTGHSAGFFCVLIFFVIRKSKNSAITIKTSCLLVFSFPRGWHSE